MGDVFEALEERARSLHPAAQVIRHALRPGEQEGHLVIRGSKRFGHMPTITVRMMSGHVAYVDDVEDAITLAHEIGHLIRYVRGLESAGYRETVDRPHAEWQEQPIENRRAVMTEERAAWALAAGELAVVGFASWHALKRRRDAGLRTYLTGLALADDSAV